MPTRWANTLKVGIALFVAVAHASRRVRGSRIAGLDARDPHTVQPEDGHAVFDSMPHKHHMSEGWLEIHHGRIAENRSSDVPVRGNDENGKGHLGLAMKTFVTDTDKLPTAASREQQSSQVRELALPDSSDAADGYNLDDERRPGQANGKYDTRGPYVRAIAAKADEPPKDQSAMGVAKDMLLNLGGGTGATVGGTGDVSLDQDLLRRMRLQDKAVMLLLLLAYAGSLAFSASLVYRQSSNDSPVTYYADPRFHNLAIDNNEVDSFLDAFNQPPKDVQLQVSGLVPLPPLPESFVDAAVEWLGSRYRVQFSFALDLSPWVVRSEEHTAPTDDADGSTRSDATVGVAAEDVTKLSDFLANNGNDLAMIEVAKKVDWREWEELAMNIKLQIRQTGFTGVINVTRSGEEVVAVHKNRPWANFMHSRTTKVLCALSVVGWLLYQPYMLLRHRATTIRAHYKVACDIAAYWPLIHDKMGPDGFDTNGRSVNL